MTDEVRTDAPRVTERDLALRVTSTLSKYGPGELAELRRLDASTPHAPAFWRLVASHLDAHLPVDETARVEAERRWAVAVGAMAEAKGFHNPSARLGVALAGVVDERRVLQLLRSHGVALADAVRMIVHHLVSKGVPFDHAELARLVLSDERDDEERVRRAIYRDFFNASPRD